ncbi:MAG: Fic family protein [Rhodobacteraceae bacterium]|nr:Fic family protein [Paracoccaceae bacterium]
MPRDLPPEPPVRIEGQLQRLLSEADLALGRLDGSIQILPNPDLFVFMYIRKEAVFSSQIEGTQSSLQDLLAAEAKILDPKRPRDVVEVLNYVAAMNDGIGHPELPVSIRLIRKIHERLMQGVRGQFLTPGELRITQNWIGPGGCTLNEAVFVPPPPHEIANALGALEKFLHADDGLPILLRIGLAHAQFETIHPFLDGNGRVGRLLITLLLCEKGVLRKPVLYLSHYFKRNRHRYYELLQTTRDDGDWEAWLEFFLQGVSEVSVQAAETARCILALRENHRAAIAENLGRAGGNGHLVLEELFVRPIVSVNEVRDLIGTAYPAANELVQKLVRLGILEEITGWSRHRRFRYSPYLRLFHEEAGD